jgi:hypothetical protein
VQVVSERTFQVWEYRVSHGSLLIRSPRDSSIDTGIDLIFLDVLYMELPRFFMGLSLDDPTPEEIRRVEGTLSPKFTTDRIWILVSSGHRYLVAGGFMKIEENEREPFESPFDFG